jgi:hypothetical protein
MDRTRHAFRGYSDDVGATRLAVLFVVGMIAFACAAEPPAMRVSDPDQPIPMPADLAELATDWMGGEDRLEPVAPSTPTISAQGAIKIAGEQLLKSLRREKVAEQDPSVPDAVIRRHYVSTIGNVATDVWVIAYRWKAGRACNDVSQGGPGTCRNAQFIFVDDRTGEIVQNFGTEY